MSRQTVYSGTTATLNTGATSFLCPYGNRITANNWYRMRAPAAGTMSNLRVVLSGAPGGVGKSYTFTVYKGVAATSLSVSIAGFADSGQDLSNTASVSAGDNLEIRVTPAGPPTARYAYICWDWTPTTADYTLMCGTTDTSQLPTSGTRYVSMCGCLRIPYTAAADARLYMPISGTFRDLYVLIGTAPGAGARDRIFTLMKNGAAQALEVTISSANTSGSDTSNTVSVAKGDYVELRSRISLSGSLPAATYLSFGMVFIPDVSGYFLVGNCGDDTLVTATGTEYAQPATGDATWGASSTGLSSTTARVVIQKMCCHLGTLPGSGSWTIQTNRPGGPSLTFGTASAQTQHADCPVVMQNSEDTSPESLWNMQCGASGVGGSLSTLSTCFALREVPNDLGFMPA